MIADSVDSATDDVVRFLSDLPSDMLAEVFLWCELESLEQALSVSQTCRVLARSLAQSRVWRRRRHENAGALALSRLAAGSFTSVALHGLSGGVRDLTMQGDLLVSGSKDNCARLWGMRTLGTCFAEWCHPNWVGAVALSHSASGLVATGGDDAKVRVWSTDVSAPPSSSSLGPTPVELKGDSHGWIAGVGWADDSGTIRSSSSSDEGRPVPPLLSCSRDGEVVVWDVCSQARLAHEYTRPVRAPGCRSSVMVTAFDMLGTCAAIARTASQQGASSNRLELAVYSVGGALHLREERVIAPSQGSVDLGPVLSLAFDRGEGGDGAGSDGSLRHGLASGSNWGAVHLWDLRSAGSTATLENGCPGGIRSLAFSGHLLVAGRDPGPLLNVWDLRVRKIVQRLQGHSNNDTLALALDADRGRIACGGRMNELRVWDLFASVN